MLPPIASKLHNDSDAQARRRRSMLYGNQVAYMTPKDLNAASIQRAVIAHFRRIMHAERCTLMLLDSATETLYFRDWEQDASVFRFDRHAGIAGEALDTGSIINIPDAYADSRFNQAIDVQTGFITRSILCAPLYSYRGGFAIGVVQMLNKHGGGPFTLADEQMMALCVQKVAHALMLVRSDKGRREKGRGHALLLKTGLEELLKRDVLDTSLNLGVDIGNTSFAQPPLSPPASSPPSLAQLVEGPRDELRRRRQHRVGHAVPIVGGDSFDAAVSRKRARRASMLRYGNRQSGRNNAEGVLHTRRVAALRNTCSRIAGVRISAARFLQRCVRRHFFGVGGFLARRDAAIVLQARTRMFFVSMSMMRRSAAAAVVQRSFRRSILRLKTPTLRQYAIQVSLMFGVLGLAVGKARVIPEWSSSVAVPGRAAKRKDRVTASRYET